MPVERIEPRQGYDLWSSAYDATPNPVVRLDERMMVDLVRSAPGERVLDAGCGTGRYFSVLTSAPARVVGMDFSLGRLRVARNKHPSVPLVRADLQAPWPFCNNGFDAILCALVGEHLDRLSSVCVEMWRILAPGGCVVFPVYHAAMATEGKEANFRKGGSRVSARGLPPYYLRTTRARSSRPGLLGSPSRSFLGTISWRRRCPPLTSTSASRCS